MPEMKLIKFAIVGAILMLGSPLSAFAQQGSSDRTYSATAIHGLPGQAETSGSIIKSGENMRLEFDQNGQSIIQILLPEQGLMFVLDPRTKTYQEIRGQVVPASTAQAKSTPCNEQSQLALCQQIGNDTVSGIKVEKWVVAAQPQTKPITILWDPTRRHALRQDFPDGSSMVMAFTAMETLNGRATEHWTIQILAPGADTLNGDWWFDPELRVVVREDLPGGETRRLENIVVGTVDPSVFQIPDGWQRQDTAAIAHPQAPLPASE